MCVRTQLSALAVLLTCCMVQSEIERFSIIMDPSEKFNVSWSFNADVTLPSKDVTFVIKCATTGWVGLGLSPNGGMTGADIIIGWVDSNGEGHIKDMHATQNGVPLVDDSQDVKLVSYSEQDGVTAIIFTRKVNTCDETNDNILDTSATRLIYAYGATDPLDNVLSNSDYHGSANRGVKTVYLLDPQTQPEEEPSDVAYFDMLISNYAVEPKDTTYYCAFFEPPVLGKKHHVISVEPIIQPGNEALVHHAVIYACWGLAQEHIRNNNKTEGVCFTAEMPEFFEACRNTVFAWAVGGTKFYFPDNAGFSIGADDGSSPEYYLMEMHYDNPNELSGWVDSSGLRFTYTPILRTEDLGTLSAGMVYGIAVPPRPNMFRAIGYCSSHCTKQWIPEEGINVFAYMLHSHLIGVGIEIDWYRDGENIGVFANDDAYDFNFQETRAFSKPKKVLPGDTLKITCTYSDPDRNRVTYGGLPSSEEMCLGFLMYYPRANISDCHSAPNFFDSAEETLFTKLSLNPITVDGKPIDLTILNNVTDWTEDRVGALQDAYKTSDHTSFCSFEGKVDRHAIPAASYPTVLDISDDDRFCKPSGAGVAHLHLTLQLLATVLLMGNSVC